jgi:hypothetical protein
MEALANWAGFIGAWLLFAGPIYQAALELQDQDIETERIQATGKKIDVPRHVSAWWWLFPPLKFFLEWRRSQEYRKAYIEALLDEDVEALMAFFNKATAWIFVAIGGFLIAFKETYELVAHYGWSNWIVWVLVVVFGAASIINTVARVHRTKRIIQYGKE